MDLSPLFREVDWRLGQEALAGGGVVLGAELKAGMSGECRVEGEREEVGPRNRVPVNGVVLDAGDGRVPLEEPLLGPLARGGVAFGVEFEAELAHAFADIPGRV